MPARQFKLAESFPLLPIQSTWMMWDSMPLVMWAMTGSMLIKQNDCSNKPLTSFSISVMAGGIILHSIRIYEKWFSVVCDFHRRLSLYWLFKEASAGRTVPG